MEITAEQKTILTSVGYVVDEPYQSHLNVSEPYYLIGVLLNGKLLEEFNNDDGDDEEAWVYCWEHYQSNLSADELNDLMASNKELHQFDSGSWIFRTIPQPFGPKMPIVYLNSEIHKTAREAYNAFKQKQK
jgi:hypothetical protein